MNQLTTIPELRLDHRSPARLYWRDPDDDGLRLLDGLRAAGAPARSLFVDTMAYKTPERCGTNPDVGGQTLEARSPRPTAHLTTIEAQLYQQPISPTWTRHRHNELERVPLKVPRKRFCCSTPAKGGKGRLATLSALTGASHVWCGHVVERGSRTRQRGPRLLHPGHALTVDPDVAAETRTKVGRRDVESR